MEPIHLLIDRSMRIRASSQARPYLQQNQPLPIAELENWTKALDQLTQEATLFLAFENEIEEAEGVTVGRYHDSELTEELFWGVVEVNLHSQTRDRMMAHAVRKERLRIAQLLHDTICQEMLGLAFATRAVGNLTASQPDRAQAEWQQLSDDAGQSVERIRSLSAALNPQSVTNERMAKLLVAMQSTTWSRPTVSIRGESGLADTITTPQARLAYSIMTEVLLQWSETPETDEVAVEFDTKADTLQMRILTDPDIAHDSPCKSPSHLLKVYIDQLEAYGGSHQPIRNEQGTLYGTVTMIPRIFS